VSAGLRTRHALVVVTVIALFTGCNSSEPPAPVARPVVPGIQLPVFEKSCAPQPGPSSVVPIRVVGRAAIVANVCIGQRRAIPVPGGYRGNYNSRGFEPCGAASPRPR